MRKRLRQALHNIRQKGVDPRGTDQPVVVDIDGSKPHWMLGMSPCLTRARASTGHYLAALGLRLTIPERLRLQALPVDIHARCEGNISDRQLGAMIGNSLSLNVVGAIVSQTLVACGLLEAGERSLMPVATSRNSTARGSRAWNHNSECSALHGIASPIASRGMAWGRKGLPPDSHH